MKAIKKITAFLLTTGFIVIIFESSVPSSRKNTMQENIGTDRSSINEMFQQEKSTYRFVGAEKCASTCHNNEKMGFQYNIWKAGRHSEAFKILCSKKAEKYSKKANIPEKPPENPACLKCHTTGAALDSSFFTSTFKKEEGATCEACHKQLSDGKTYLPKESDCLKCHNNSIHKINRFNFVEMVAKIAHPRPKNVSAKN